MTLPIRDARGIAHQMMREHLPETWSFSFDNAKRRAGACNFTTRVISVSKYFVAQADEDDLRQVLLHEIAHALVGPGVGHGTAWKVMARKLGYTGKRTLEKQFAESYAAWVGRCPTGHAFHRFKKPTHVSSCTACAPTFSRKHLIEWVFIPPEHRGKLSAKSVS